MRVSMSGAIQEVGSTDFDQIVLASTVPVLVDFWAETCGPCLALAPTLDKIAEEMAGKFILAKVDVGAHRMVAAKYGVISIPTLLLFKEGEIVERLVGLKPKDEIVRKIEQHL